MRLFLALLLILTLPTAVARADADDFIAPFGLGEHIKWNLKVTGTVVSQDTMKIRSCAIINDKIWWEDQAYFIKDGKNIFPISPSGPAIYTEEEPVTVYLNKDGSRVYGEEQIALLTHISHEYIQIQYMGSYYNIPTGHKKLR